MWWTRIQPRWSPARAPPTARSCWTRGARCCAATHPGPLLAGTNTTIGVIATDAVITKLQATKLAQMAHDGLARSINPVHTMSDGDTLFALGTGRVKTSPGMMVLGTMAAEATARAVVRAVLAARGLTAGTLHLPAAGDL
jgi:L-aminopeptidase/D-esterase-like protein